MSLLIVMPDLVRGDATLGRLGKRLTNAPICRIGSAHDKRDHMSPKAAWQHFLNNDM